MTERHLYKAWAAVRDGKVVNFISMKNQGGDFDFDAFRVNAIKCLEMVGDVYAGDVVITNRALIFRRRLNHANRGKAERKPQEYPIHRLDRS